MIDSVRRAERGSIDKAAEHAVGGLSADGGSGAAALLIIESCHSTWLFDREQQRFRRVLKGLDLDARHGSTNWRQYHALEFDEDSGGFTVLLNELGTRLIRSWRHTEQCPHCDSRVTGELSVDDLRSLVNA